MKLYIFFILAGALASTHNLGAMEHPTKPQEKVSIEQQELDQSLIDAILANNIEATQSALERGAHANAYGTAAKIPAVILAAVMPDALHLLRLLIEHGADINTPSPTKLKYRGTPISQSTTPLFVFIAHNLAQQQEITFDMLTQFMLLGAHANLPEGASIDDYPPSIGNLLFLHGYRPASSRDRIVAQIYDPSSLAFGIATYSPAYELPKLDELTEKAKNNTLTAEDTQLLQQAFLLAIAQRDNNLASVLLVRFAQYLDLPSSFLHAALIGDILALRDIYATNGDLPWANIFARALVHALAQKRYEAIFEIFRIAKKNKIAIDPTIFEHALLQRLSINTLSQEERSKLEYFLNYLYSMYSEIAGNMAQQELNSKLIHAIQHDDIEATRNALADGAHADALDETGAPAIILAATSAHALELVRLLVAHGADINIPLPSNMSIRSRMINRGNTPLFAFIDSSQTEITSEQLTQFMLLGANLNFSAPHALHSPPRALDYVLFEYGWTPSLKRLVALNIKDSPLRAYTIASLDPADLNAQKPRYQQLQKEALSLFAHLQEKANNDELTHEDVDLLQQVFLLAIGQRNNTVLNMILEHLPGQIHLASGFARAALVGNTDALQAIFQTASDLSPTATNLLSHPDIFGSALSAALAQRHRDTVRWILHTAFQHNIALDLTTIEQALTQRLALPRLSSQERKQLEGLLQDIQAAQAGSLLRTHARGLDIGQATFHTQRLPPELLALLMPFVLHPLHKATSKHS